MSHEQNSENGAPLWNLGSPQAPRDDEDRLPDFLLNRLPDYIKLFCNPTIDDNGVIKLNLVLDDNFYQAFTRHHKMVVGPTIFQVKEAIERDLRLMFNPKS